MKLEGCDLLGIRRPDVLVGHGSGSWLIEKGMLSHYWHDVNRGFPSFRDFFDDGGWARWEDKPQDADWLTL